MNAVSAHTQVKIEKKAISKSGSCLLVPDDAFRFNNLNFLRSLLAIIVLLSHCYLIYYGTVEEVEPLYLWSGSQLTLDILAVNFFFVISGFLILKSWESNPAFGQFLKKRILRIYPAFIVVSVLCLFVFAPFGTGDYFKPFGYWSMYFDYMDWKSIPLNILYLNEPKAPWVFKNLPIEDSLNKPIWTIKFEFFCYLTIPLLGWVKVFKSKIVCLLLFLIFYGVYVYQYFTKTSFFGWKEYAVIGQPDMIVQFITFFFAGVILYVFRKDFLRKRAYLYLSLLIVICAIIFNTGLAIVLPIFGSYILFHLTFARSYSLIGFSKWGDFSYSIYLFSWPIQQLVLMYLEKYMDVTLLFILSTSITICFSYLSWHYIEKPSLGLKNFRFNLAKNKSNHSIT